MLIHADSKRGKQHRAAAMVFLTDQAQFIHAAAWCRGYPSASDANGETPGGVILHLRYFVLSSAIRVLCTNSFTSAKEDESTHPQSILNRRLPCLYVLYHRNVDILLLYLCQKMPGVHVIDQTWMADASSLSFKP